MASPPRGSVVPRALEPDAAVVAARRARIDAALAPHRTARHWLGQVLPPPAGVPGYALHVGSWEHAFDGAALEARRVTHVLRMHSRGMAAPPPEGVWWPRARRAVVLHSWEVDDVEGAPLLASDDTATALGFVHGALAGGGRVLVTCRAGVNRSVTLAAAYVALTHAGRADAVPEMLACLASQRTYALSNASFRAALAALDVDAWRAHLGWDAPLVALRGVALVAPLVATLEAPQGPLRPLRPPHDCRSVSPRRAHVMLMPSSHPRLRVPPPSPRPIRTVSLPREVADAADARGGAHAAASAGAHSAFGRVTWQ